MEMRIKCGYCDCCFPLVESETSLRLHIELDHPGVDTEMIPVDIIETPEPSHTRVQVPIELYESDEWDIFNGSELSYDVSDIPPTEPDVIVEHDLWETCSAWNSMNKTEGI